MMHFGGYIQKVSRRGRRCGRDSGLAPGGTAPLRWGGDIAAAVLGCEQAGHPPLARSGLSSRDAGRSWHRPGGDRQEAAAAGPQFPPLQTGLAWPPACAEVG